MRRALLSLAVLFLAAPPLPAQSLREEFSQLFIFGEGEDPLFLGGTGDPNDPESVRIHGNHFVPAAGGWARKTCDMPPPPSSRSSTYAWPSADWSWSRRVEVTAPRWKDSEM